MARESIPKKIKEAVLDEYDHRCAVCAGDRPHLHHVNEDATDNDPMNLLPLCPNCHLRDQHNPTKKIDVGKLKLFRKYKDPTILKPQFHPIYERTLFLNEIEINDSNVAEIENRAKELIEFVASLEMGDFYSKRLNELVGPLKRVFVMALGGGPDPHYERQRKRANYDYREKISQNKDDVYSLIVELLRYQKW
ncbi:hypothetical protein HNR65_002131 [Desulfosalsimonas propionicica]|uniref:HNH nuclease domain-containing protein n=1 Tax=Desulfosalsimonas propionicica TaxID=332175 RepID=A0A7W0C9W8_9BACT|nr:HNH endonuclease signature motif containing protein [Desulfosalsimonas propionicica]MBA2881800.1 hypothetical protein [Desulfosalsimonas propionicica]